MKNRLLVLILVISILSAVTLYSFPYVSLNGKFYIEIPDHWEQVDYVTVDLFLNNTNSGRDAFNYEAVFSKKVNGPFFTTEYLFLKIKKIKNMSQRTIDSVLTDLTDIYVKRVVRKPFDEIFKNISLARPYYDKQNKVAVIFDILDLPDETRKKNLIINKFVDYGIVSFFFYSPDSSYNDNLNRFIDIYKSYGTDNIEDKLPKENLKVADIDVSDGTDDDTDESESSNYIPYFILLLIIVIVVTRLKKRKKNS